MLYVVHEFSYVHRQFFLVLRTWYQVTEGLMRYHLKQATLPASLMVPFSPSMGAARQRIRLIWTEVISIGSRVYWISSTRRHLRQSNLLCWPSQTASIYDRQQHLHQLLYSIKDPHTRFTNFASVTVPVSRIVSINDLQTCYNLRFENDKRKIS